MSRFGAMPARELAHEAISEIASGTTATVFLSRITTGPRSGELIAVKRLRPSVADDPGVTMRFLDEAWMTAALEHPNVVGVLGWGKDDRGPYLAVELVQGVSLARLMKTVFDTGEEFTERMVVYLGVCMAQGLDAAHALTGTDGQSLGLVHRDLSPANILLGFDGAVKITDFGLAKAKERLAMTTVGLPPRDTRYMAPEELRGKEIDQRVDLFALGIILFELLAGRAPWAGKTGVETMQLMIKDKPPELMSLRPKMDKRLSEIIMHGIERDRRSRFQRAGELIEQLELWLYTHGYQESNQETLARFVRRNAMKQMRWFERATQGDVPLRPERPRRTAAPPPPPPLPRARVAEPDRGARTAVGIRVGQDAPPAPPTRQDVPPHRDSDWEVPTVVARSDQEPPPTRPRPAAGAPPPSRRMGASEPPRPIGAGAGAGAPAAKIGPGSAGSRLASEVEGSVRQARSTWARDTTLDLPAQHRAMAGAGIDIVDADSEEGDAPTVALRRSDLPWAPGEAPKPKSRSRGRVERESDVPTGRATAPTQGTTGSRPSRPAGGPSLAEVETELARFRARASRRHEEARAAHERAERVRQEAKQAAEVAEEADQALALVTEASRLARDGRWDDAAAKLAEARQRAQVSIPPPRPTGSRRGRS